MATPKGRMSGLDKSCIFLNKREYFTELGFLYGGVSGREYAMLNDLESLPNDPVELQGIVTLLAREVKSQALFIEKLQLQLHVANRHRFGSKSESLDQLQLFVENDEIAVAAAVSYTHLTLPTIYSV